MHLLQRAELSQTRPGALSVWPRNSLVGSGDPKTPVAIHGLSQVQLSRFKVLKLKYDFWLKTAVASAPLLVVKALSEVDINQLVAQVKEISPSPAVLVLEGSDLMRSSAQKRLAVRFSAPLSLRTAPKHQATTLLEPHVAMVRWPGLNGADLVVSQPQFGSCLVSLEPLAPWMWSEASRWSSARDTEGRPAKSKERTRKSP